MKSKLARISNWIGILSICTTALISFAADTPPGCLTPPAGLVAWYAGEGDANDSINSNQGNLSGGLGFAPGEVGQAFDRRRGWSSSRLSFPRAAG